MSILAESQLVDFINKTERFHSVKGSKLKKIFIDMNINVDKIPKCMDTKTYLLYKEACYYSSCKKREPCQECDKSYRKDMMLKRKCNYLFVQETEKDKINKKIGNKIKKLRKKYKVMALSQQELSKKCGLKHYIVSRIERGDPDTKPEHLNKILNFFNITKEMFDNL